MRRAFQAPGAGRDLADGQRGRVVDEERAAFEVARGVQVAFELGLGQVTLGGSVPRVILGGLRQDPLCQLGG